MLFLQSLIYSVLECRESQIGIHLSTGTLNGSKLAPVASGIRVDLPSGGLDLKKYLAKIEQDMIHQALVESDGVVQRAAELLGVGRTTLVEKIRRYELSPPKKRSH